MKQNFDEKLELSNKYSVIAAYYRDKKYNKVINEATEYLKKQPNNANVRFMRAKCYREFEMFPEAIKDLEYNVKKFNNFHSITELYYLYYFLNMYNEALALLPTLYRINTINPYSLALTELVMKTSMNIEMKFRDDSDDYIKMQIRNYNKEKALMHIYKHTELVNDKSIFNSDINLEYLFEVVENNICKSKKMNEDEIMEIHYFLLPNIGNINGNVCNYIKVIVIPGTTKIINMYPSNEEPKNNNIVLECDYGKLFNKKEQKVKTNSRIDKFNQRYKR